jgi:hypothetical protein
MTLKLTSIDQEIKVWYALSHEGSVFDNPYTAFVSTLTHWNKTVELPTKGKVKLIDNSISEDEGEDSFVIFSVDDKIYRIDGDEYSSWSSDRDFYAPYEVESKVVTETRYVRV